MSFLALALTLAASLQTAEDAAGRYVAGANDAACSLTLRPSALQLPESNLEGEAASGFAFAAPGCPYALSEAALWRLTLSDGLLTLVNGAGETLFEGRAEDAGWAGETAGGDALTLRPR